MTINSLIISNSVTKNKLKISKNNILLKIFNSLKTSKIKMIILMIIAEFLWKIFQLLFIFNSLKN